MMAPMQTRVAAAVLLAVAGVLAIAVESVRAWLALRRLDEVGAGSGGGPQASVHPPDWVTLGGVWAVVAACGLAAGWVWAGVLGIAGAVALWRYGGAARLEITSDALAFGAGRIRAELPLAELGAVVVAPRSGGMRNFGAVAFSDVDGAWVGLVRAAAVRDPAGAVALLVSRCGLGRHPDELGWRRPSAAPPTGSLPRLQR